ncbi:MAG: tryptophan synthase subunit alpha [Deltaproteobacteria bacterium]|nr:tryptophan synthase subunit alpha [Deltaproteobacteria bacterium]
MNRIDTTFKNLKEKGESGLVGFVTAGDPDMQRSLEIVQTMCAAGLDVLELGIPFSDPTADGPVIQRSSARSLAGGTNLPAVMTMTREVRAATDIPIILFSYYNPILAYGPGEFYDDAVAAGADGVLVVDLPPEESDEMTDLWPGEALSLIRLVAPTTPRERMQTIAGAASGFLYLVSKTGVTGSDGLDLVAVSANTAVLKSVSNLPVCVGFGISTPEDVAAVAAAADGVVIGSAFERIIEENLDHPELVPMVGDAVKRLKGATVR